MRKLLLVLVIIFSAVSLYSGEGSQRSYSIKKHDFGLGLYLGFTPGIKIRYLHTSKGGFTAGFDIDAGSIILFSNASLSAVIGYSFGIEEHLIRFYGTISGKYRHAVDLFSDESDSFKKNNMDLRAGMGIEWKPMKWFGFGIDGGLDIVMAGDGVISGVPVFPYGSASILMFYF